jgi:hypothetical protein
MWYGNWVPAVYSKVEKLYSADSYIDVSVKKIK